MPILHSLQIWQSFQNVAVLSNVVNIVVPSNIAKCCRVLNKIKKMKCVKIAKLAGSSDVAELSNVTMLSTVADITETLKMSHMLLSFQKNRERNKDD